MLCNKDVIVVKLCGRHGYGLSLTFTGKEYPASSFADPSCTALRAWHFWHLNMFKSYLMFTSTRIKRSPKKYWWLRHDCCTVCCKIVCIFEPHSHPFMFQRRAKYKVPGLLATCGSWVAVQWWQVSLLSGWFVVVAAPNCGRCNPRCNSNSSHLKFSSVKNVEENWVSW